MADGLVTEVASQFATRRIRLHFPEKASTRSNPGKDGSFDEIQFIANALTEGSEYISTSRNNCFCAA
jgi:hypothetical protein